jgi:hypothetical protein
MGVSRVLRRSGVTAVLLVAAVSAFGTAVASAQSVGSGSLSFNGTAGDYISAGQSYSYSAPTDTLSVYGSGSGNHVEVAWHLHRRGQR